MTHENLVNVEQVDDRLRKAGEIVKRGNDWLARDKISFIDRYLSGEFHLVLRRSFLHESNYGFLIVHHHKSTVIRDYGEKFSMLTHNVELMKSPKILVPSFIRFQRFKNFSDIRRESVYEFRSLSIPFDEFVPAGCDWKINLLGVGYAGIAASYSRRQNIQTASQDIQVGADFDIEEQRKRLFLTAYYDVIRAIRIVIYDFGIEVELEPGVNPLSQGWELGFGPIDAGYGI